MVKRRERTKRALIEFTATTGHNLISGVTRDNDVDARLPSRHEGLARADAPWIHAATHASIVSTAATLAVLGLPRYEWGLRHCTARNDGGDVHPG